MISHGSHENISCAAHTVSIVAHKLTIINLNCAETDSLISYGNHENISCGGHTVSIVAHKLAMNT